MYQLEITIQGLPATRNSIGRKHWSVLAKEARQWRRLVALSIGVKKPPKPLKRAMLELTRVSSVAPDHSGLVEAFKHVIDGLVDAGVIADDKLTNIGFPKYHWVQCKKNEGHIIIRVTEIDQGAA